VIYNRLSICLLAATGGYWRLLAATGGYWLLLAATGGYWRLLAVCWRTTVWLRGDIIRHLRNQFLYFRGFFRTFLSASNWIIYSLIKIIYEYYNYE
jgi:small-conductance mechanosensitive channel